jgi:hypothetical protein
MIIIMVNKELINLHILTNLYKIVYRRRLEGLLRAIDVLNEGNAPQIVKESHIYDVGEGLIYKIDLDYDHIGAIEPYRRLICYTMDELGINMATDVQLEDIEFKDTIIRDCIFIPRS